MSRQNFIITAWHVVSEFIVDITIILVSIGVSKQTPCYRGDAVKFFDNFKDDYKNYVID